MGILDGKRILVTGVLTDSSIAFGVAKTAQQEGAEVILTGAGRGLSQQRVSSDVEVDDEDAVDVVVVTGYQKKSRAKKLGRKVGKFF